MKFLLAVVVLCVATAAQAQDAQTQQALRLCKNQTCRAAIQSGLLKPAELLACHRAKYVSITRIESDWAACKAGMSRLARAAGMEEE